MIALPDFAARKMILAFYALAPVAIAVSAGVVGAATSRGWILVGAAVLLTSVTALAIACWRRVAVLLLACLPFTGVLSLLLYPDTLLGDAARDVFVVAPLYLGLLASRESARLPRSVVLPTALLSGFVLLQLSNPSLPSTLVGLVGVRGWLFFIPLIVVGARLGSDLASALRAMRVALLAGLPVLAIGVIEAVALAEGKGGTVYRFYGAAAPSAFSTGDTTLQGAPVSLGKLHRVPSLFSYPSAYYAFCLAMLVPAYLLWRHGERVGTRRLGLFGFVLAVIGGLTCGIREAFITVPLALVVTLYLDGVRMSIRSLLAGVTGFCVAVTLLRVPVFSLPQYLFDLSRQEGQDVVVGGFRLAHSVTWLGLGPGTDTNAVRNVAGPGVFDAIGGRWQESYFVKTWIELGLPGLLLVIWMFGALVQAVGSRAGSLGPARPLVAACAGLLFAALATSTKGAILDQAPASAYFWLFAGMAIGARAWAPSAERAPAKTFDSSATRYGSALHAGLATVRPRRAQ